MVSSWFKGLFAEQKTSGCGIIYVVVGDRKHTENALISAASVRKQNDRLGMTLFTDRKFEGIDYARFESVVLIERMTYLWGNRMAAMLQSPYDKTLYLDADSYLLDDVEEMFGLLDRFDYAVSHGGNRMKRHEKAVSEGIIDPAVPYAFAPLGGGTQLIRKNKKTNCFLRELLAESARKTYDDDQALIRKILWENRCGMAFYILPMEYRIGQIAFIDLWARGINRAVPKILFYTQKKNGPDHEETIRRAIELTRQIKESSHDL